MTKPNLFGQGFTLLEQADYVPKGLVEAAHNYRIATVQQLYQGLELKRSKDGLTDSAESFGISVGVLEKFMQDVEERFDTGREHFPKIVRRETGARRPPHIRE
ncbi:MAG: hypothetical protein AABW58_04750 [Nanoarchaeota archaeon]